MARLDDEEIERYIEHVRRSLRGIVFGRVVIEVRGGHIHQVVKSEDKATVLNGRPIGD